MDIWNDADDAVDKVRAQLRPGPIAWGAVTRHALIGAAVTLLVEVLWHGWGALALLALLLAFTASETLAARSRNGLSLQEAAELVWHGEPGWSRWNLRLRAAAPAIAGLAVLLVAALLR